MHLLIPYAFCNAEACRQAAATLQLPQLAKLLRRLTPASLDAGDEFSLSMPHERALARILGLPTPDGLIPWAAWQAHTGGLAPETRDGWAFITPCNWQIGSKHVAMARPELPDFLARESQALVAMMQPYFAEDGITLHYELPGRWLASGDVFKELATASLDRVAGCSVTSWLPSARRALSLQRLQSEMQMLLYHHPVNDARSARGVPSVNSFWVSGTGALPEPPDQAATASRPVVVTTLRDAALNEDWPAWVQAWQALDAADYHGLLAEAKQGGSAQLTVCGERNAQSFIAGRPTIGARLMGAFGTQRPFDLLEKL